MRVSDRGGAGGGGGGGEVGDTVASTLGCKMDILHENKFLRSKNYKLFSQIGVNSTNI